MKLTLLAVCCWCQMWLVQDTLVEVCYISRYATDTAVKLHVTTKRKSAGLARTLDQEQTTILIMDVKSNTIIKRMVNIDTNHFEK